MMPNFIVIGAAKAGTTSLHHILAQHPDVYMCPVKGPRFFEFDGGPPDYRGPYDDFVTSSSVYDLSAYETLFAGVTHEHAIGEVSPSYLAFEGVPDRIRRHVPDARLIAILRNPADRAYSHYMMKFRDGVETVSFEEALRLEPQRIRDHWRVGRYFQQGLYYEQLRRYYDRFPTEQIRVYLYEDFRNDALSVVQDMFRFLGVDATFVPDISQQHNVSGAVRNPFLRTLWNRSRGLRRRIRWLLPASVRDRAYRHLTRDLVKVPLSAELRAQLLQRYERDMENLERLLQRDLSIWRESPKVVSGSAD